VKTESKKLPGGAILRVAPGTQYNLGRPIKVQLGASGEMTLADTVQLTSGRIEVDLPNVKKPTTAVLVQAPSKISAVAKGGHSVVIAAPDRVAVAAVSGDMLVASGNDWRMLGSTLVREFPRGGAASDHAVLPAPQVTLSTPVMLSVAGSSTSFQANASPVPRANGYAFQLFRVRGTERTLVREAISATPSTTFSAVDPGTYAVDARAIEASGLEGGESAPASLRVVAAELPPGGRLMPTGILLPPDERVRLLGTEGVEISYGKAADFVAAPSTIGVIRGDTTLVRLRAAGSKDELRLTLEPRTLHADVQLGPARASWPHDDVVIAVRVTDASGKGAEKIELKPTVFVNVSPVDVDWKRDGNLLTGVVPRARDGGPWVVRVEIKDDTGALIGRNFLEVANDARSSSR
jgi:hypothetical protein